MHETHSNPKIGPNAIIQLAATLRNIEGDAICRGIFQQADLLRYLDGPPSDMVPEIDIARLHAAMHRKLGDARARTLGWLAGRLTALYLLEHRIPRPVQWLMRLLPRRISALLLSALIARHAWTFAGSGQLRIIRGAPMRIVITGCPLVMGANSDEPWCDYFAGTLETLFARLVDSRARVVETSCAAQGAACCCFEVRLTRVSPAQRASGTPLPAPKSAPATA
jgi:divinyl protochlorophyllide a 8-vinyl-reductase